jgi:hypothetical protein
MFQSNEFLMAYTKESLKLFYPYYIAEPVDFRREGGKEREREKGE